MRAICFVLAAFLAVQSPVLAKDTKARSAIPATNPGNWVTDEDYPTWAVIPEPPESSHSGLTLDQTANQPTVL